MGPGSVLSKNSFLRKYKKKKMQDDQVKQQIFHGQ